MENFVEKYSKLLDDSGKHLSYEIISAYINLFNNLSIKEKKFVKEHLNKCLECNEKYNEVFDEDFEFDENTIAINFYQISVDETKKVYQSDNGKIELLFNKENSIITFVFTRLPDEYKNQNFRISAGGTVLRILSAEENKSYYLNQLVILEDISEIKVLFLKIYNGAERTSPKFKLKRYYGIAAAAILIAMLIIGYFYFSPVEKKVVAVNENKIAVDSSFNKEKGKNKLSNKNGQKENEENLMALNNVTEKDFKENSVLENFVNRNVRSEENIKIIFPSIGDTLIKNVRLKWASSEKGTGYQIIIVNNRNEKVWEITTDSNTIMVEKKLLPGLYYWKIENDGKLETIGKFFIK